jgi:cell division protein FtsB
MLNQIPPTFHVVQGRPSRHGILLAVMVAVLWLSSLAAMWWWASTHAVSGYGDSQQRLRAAEREIAALHAQGEDLEQRNATLARSDQISRQANQDLQDTLSQRDEEISGLRADTAFYDRLVGPTAKREGLNVFSSEFTSGGGNMWKYRIMLTQTLNRGAISAGHMSFTVEGTQDGKPATLDWAQLHPQSDASEQSYSFRYFQRMEGSVTLPVGFVPQRVRVSLRGGDAVIDRDFDWKTADTHG